MATKKAKSSSAKPDKAEVKKLRAELTSAKSKRDQWKKRAGQAEATAADLRSRLKVAEKQLKKAKKADGATPAAAPAPAAPSVPESTVDEVASDVRRVDASWTVTELRAEARRRGIAGVSRKPKAALLTALA